MTWCVKVHVFGTWLGQCCGVLQVEKEWKMSQKAKIEAGKTPYYLKQSEKKKRVLEKKFDHLEETGQLDKYMLKKRKRVASKMHKKLPFRRIQQGN